MTIKGLDETHEPFKYLDDYCPAVDWESLHNETCYGLSQIPWIKRYVSAGVHSEWSDSEITTYARNKRFTSAELEYYNKIPLHDTEQRIKYT